MKSTTWLIFTMLEKYLGMYPTDGKPRAEIPCDGPNAITACGLVCIGAIFLVATRHPEYAMALLIWAVMLDHIDGWLARRLKRRPRNYALVGGDMDSATDMVSAAIVPGLIGIQLSGGTVLSLIAALLIAVAACLRVGYFNNFGLTDAGRFYGVPLTYTVPMTGLCLGAGKLVNSLPASLTLPWVLIVMAVLHVCPFGLPPVRGIGFLLVFVYAYALSWVMICL